MTEDGFVQLFALEYDGTPFTAKIKALTSFEGAFVYKIISIQTTLCNANTLTAVLDKITFTALAGQ